MKKEVSDLHHQVCKLINVQYSVIMMYKESLLIKSQVFFEENFKNPI